MSLFLETISIQNRIAQNIEYHQNRVDQCSLIQLEPFLKRISVATNKWYKLTIQFTETQIIKYQLIPYHPRVINTFKILIDNKIDYSFKYADRTQIEQLMQKKETCDDIIIIKNGEVTDCSFANLLFFDGEKWITPENPLLKGTCRARLLDQRIIVSKNISIEDIQAYSKIMLVNALLDFDETRSILISPTTFI